MIVTPERKQAAVDVIDEALSMLRVVNLALGNEGEVDDLGELRETLNEVARKLKPLREALNRAHGTGQEIG